MDRLSEALRLQPGVECLKSFQKGDRGKARAIAVLRESVFFGLRSNDDKGAIALSFGKGNIKQANMRSPYVRFQT